MTRNNSLGTGNRPRRKTVGVTKRKIDHVYKDLILIFGEHFQSLGLYDLTELYDKKIIMKMHIALHFDNYLKKKLQRMFKNDLLNALTGSKMLSE